MAKKQVESEVIESPADEAGLTEQETAALEAMEKGEEFEVADDDEGSEESTEHEPEDDPEPEAEEVVVSKGDPVDAEDEKPREQTTVPLAALDSERHKRKELEAQMAVLADQVKTLSNPAPAPQPQEEPLGPAPDPLVDQEGFQAWLDKRDAINRAPVEQMQAQFQQQAQFNDLKGFASASEAAFSAEKPDYKDAFAYAQQKKAEEFRDYGYSEEQIPLLLGQTEASITALARMQGVNPAQIVYNYALRNGYTGKAEEPGDPGKKITKLASAQKKTQSAGGAGGAPREDELSLEKIADMDQDDFDALPDSEIKKIMGG